ncbi:MAG: hypothetical protein EBS01_16395, partial [Verrucomicrobia bacterium]|nr:hypothetical protein [Verrucomicrobiota bacterium]
MIAFRTAEINPSACHGAFQMQTLLLHDEILGDISLGPTNNRSGILQPAIFARRKSTEHRSVGVIYRDREGEPEYITLHPIAQAYTDNEVKILGWRWTAFVSALIARGRTLTAELARDAWFATNTQPTSITRGAVDHGLSAMRAQIGDPTLV